MAGTPTHVPGEEYTQHPDDASMWGGGIVLVGAFGLLATDQLDRRRKRKQKAAAGIGAELPDEWFADDGAGPESDGLGQSPQLSTTTPIETIRVGERVLVDAPQAALDADPRYRGELDLEPIDPEKYRLVRVRAEERWPDGTVDVTHVESLQPWAWIESQQLEVGSAVTPPLDLLEMGLLPPLSAIGPVARGGRPERGAGGRHGPRIDRPAALSPG